MAAVVVEHPLLRDGEAQEAVDLARRINVAVHSLDLDPRGIKEGESVLRGEGLEDLRLRVHGDIAGLRTWTG